MTNYVYREPVPLEENNICWLNSDIEGSVTGYVVKFLLEKHYQKDNKPDHIKMIVNSQGGDIYDGFAIIDTMNMIDIPIWTYALGQVCSAGLLIFMSGVPGKRHFLKNSCIMSHQWSGYMEGKEHEIRASEKENKLVSNRMMNHYIKCTGLSKKEIKEKLLPPEDVYLSPTEAVKYGLGDRIITKL